MLVVSNATKSENIFIPIWFHRGWIVCNSVCVTSACTFLANIQKKLTMHPEPYTEPECTRNSLIFDVADSVQARDAMEKFLKVFVAEKNQVHVRSTSRGLMRSLSTCRSTFGQSLRFMCITLANVYMTNHREILNAWRRLSRYIQIHVVWPKATLFYDVYTRMTVKQKTKNS